LVDKTANYPYDDNDGNGKYKLDPLYARNYAEPYVYEFENGVKWEAPAGTYPRYSKKSLKEMYEKNEIVFSGSTPKAKRFLKNVQEGVPPDTLLPTEMVKFNKDGTEHMIKVFGVKVFDKPKPTTLIKYLMNLQRKVDTDKNYIVMDSFAGSGTTGQAVMEQNEEDGGNRKFILIQIDEQLESNKQEHQTACDFLDKINKDYYIVELTKERLKRVIQGYSFSGKEKTELFSKKFTSAQILNLSTMEKVINEVNDIFTHEECNFNEIKKTFKENTLKVIGEREIEEFREGLGGGFQYCELSEPLFDEFGLLNENITHTMLAKHLYFTEFGQALKVENDLKNFIGTVKEVSLFLYSDQDFKKKNLMSILDKFEEKAIVYADRTTISKDELEKHNIVFKQLPFSIKDK
jgi:adenine-specific DNA-methyltransferase